MLDEAMKTVKILSLHYAYISVASYSSLYARLPSSSTEENLELYQQPQRIPQKPHFCIRFSIQNVVVQKHGQDGFSASRCAPHLDHIIYVKAILHDLAYWYLDLSVLAELLVDACYSLAATRIST